MLNKRQNLAMNYCFYRVFIYAFFHSIVHRTIDVHYSDKFMQEDKTQTQGCKTNTQNKNEADKQQCDMKCVSDNQTSKTESINLYISCQFYFFTLIIYLKYFD